ncbi:MAG: 2-amino-4-hydroxy-6-hydroxymethyldihydropteridine diphosphokinase [Rhizomicrobium sp.]
MILIALGANLESRAGVPAQTLNAALAEIEQRGAKIVGVSPYYITPAWPDPSDPPFVNAVARVASELSPHALMALLHDTETSFGRVRSTPNAPRTLDLDLVDYDGRVDAGPPVLPHPRIAERAFVLVPLADVAPDWIHPVTGKSVTELIAALPDAERRIARLTSRT